jgi:hypothetical protein
MQVFWLRPRHEAPITLKAGDELIFHFYVTSLTLFRPDQLVRILTLK